MSNIINKAWREISRLFSFRKPLIPEIIENDSMKLLEGPSANFNDEAVQQMNQKIAQQLGVDPNYSKRERDAWIAREKRRRQDEAMDKANNGINNHVDMLQRQQKQDQYLASIGQQSRQSNPFGYPLPYVRDPTRSISLQQDPYQNWPYNPPNPLAGTSSSSSTTRSSSSTTRAQYPEWPTVKDDKLQRTEIILLDIRNYISDMKQVDYDVINISKDIHHFLRNNEMARDIYNIDIDALLREGYEGNVHTGFQDEVDRTTWIYNRRRQFVGDMDDQEAGQCLFIFDTGYIITPLMPFVDPGSDNNHYKLVITKMNLVKTWEDVPAKLADMCVEGGGFQSWADSKDCFPLYLCKVFKSRDAEYEFVKNMTSDPLMIYPTNGNVMGTYSKEYVILKPGKVMSFKNCRVLAKFYEEQYIKKEHPSVETELKEGELQLKNKED